MKKLNTYAFYSLAVKVHRLTRHIARDCKLGDLALDLYNANMEIRLHLTELSILPETSRRAGVTLLATITEVIDFTEEADDEFWNRKVSAYNVQRILDEVRNFEAVLASDLPGLSTYLVLPKGIYSTSELTERAHAALYASLPLDAHESISESEKSDFQQAGRCLAFELPTASGYHAMRAAESIVKRYWREVHQKPEDGDAPPLGVCIENLRTKGEDRRVLDILDHLRDLSRNPIAHPDIFLEMHEAYRTFDIAKSAICAVAMRLKELKGQLELGFSIEEDKPPESLPL